MRSKWTHVSEGLSQILSLRPKVFWRRGSFLKERHVVTRFLAFLFMAGALSAGPITFDLESLNLGDYTTLSSTVGGVTMTVTRESGLTFSLVDSSAFSPVGPAAFGTRTLSPFGDTSNSAFIFTFSSVISSFSIQLGDYGGDLDTWSVTGFSGTAGSGTNLGDTTGTWGNGNFSLGDPPQTAALNQTGMRSVVVIGGSADFPNSLYFDNVIVDTASNAPEPGTLLMIPTGLAALAFLRRRAAGRKPQRSHHYPLDGTALW
jgi:hypothetical protein